MGFNSAFKGLINVLYVNKQEVSASYTMTHGQPIIKILRCVWNPKVLF